MDIQKQVKINAGKIERRFGVVMTPFSFVILINLVFSNQFDFSHVSGYGYQSEERELKNKVVSKFPNQKQMSTTAWACGSLASNIFRKRKVSSSWR